MQVLIPAIKKMLGPNATDADILKTIGDVFRGNQNAASAVQGFFKQYVNSHT